MAPEIVLTPPGTDITMQHFVVYCICDNACVIISAPGIRRILGLIANIGLHGAAPKIDVAPNLIFFAHYLVQVGITQKIRKKSSGKMLK